MISCKLEFSWFQHPALPVKTFALRTLALPLDFGVVGGTDGLCRGVLLFGGVYGAICGGSRSFVDYFELGRVFVGRSGAIKGLSSFECGGVGVGVGGGLSADESDGMLAVAF